MNKIKYEEKEAILWLKINIKLNVKIIRASNRFNFEYIKAL